MKHGGADQSDKLADICAGGEKRDQVFLQNNYEPALCAIMPALFIIIKCESFPVPMLTLKVLRATLSGYGFHFFVNDQFGFFIFLHQFTSS